MILFSRRRLLLKIDFRNTRNESRRLDLPLRRFTATNAIFATQALLATQANLSLTQFQPHRLLVATNAIWPHRPLPRRRFFCFLLLPHRRCHTGDFATNALFLMPHRLLATDAYFYFCDERDFVDNFSVFSFTDFCTLFLRPWASTNSQILVSNYNYVKDAMQFTSECSISFVLRCCSLV